MPDLRTFDVFDTLLTRRVGLPSSVFLLLGARARDSGLLTCSAEVFARSRQQAEPLAVAVSSTGFAGLEAIYRQLSRLLGLSADEESALAEAECELERELIVPVPGAREHLDSLRDEGAEIAFVSDMYHSSEFIGSMLSEHGLRRPSEPVYVSAEVGRSKRSGDMFDHVLSEHRRAPEQVTHVGDDRRGDVERPQQRGITACRFTEASLTRYEHALEAHRWESDGLASVMAGASRLARLDVPAASDHDRAIRDVTAGAAAPLLVGYVIWILQRARELRLDRLYFVSRDGESLLQIAEALKAPLSIDIDLRYIYGSRQAWYPAVAGADRPELAVPQLRHPFDDSLHVLLDRCGVEPTAWLQHDPVDQNADRDRDVLDRLLSTPEFLDEVREGLQGRQDRLTRYLTEVGMLDAGRHGVVDLGWHGKSLSYLSDLMQRHRRPAPTGFYLGLTAREGLLQPVEVWLEGLERRVRIAMMETFCAGTHGQVVDYSVSADGGVAPVMKEERNTAAIEWGLPVLRSTLNSFTGHVAEVVGSSVTPSIWRGNVRHASLESFDLFYSQPTMQEARAWGSFPFEVSPVAASLEQLARERSLRSRVQARFVKSGAPVRWPAGDLALAPRSWQMLSSAWGAGKMTLRRARPTR